MEKTKLVAVNDQGRRIGETHPRAKLTDHEVDLIRDLVESLVSDGKTKKEAYALAAQKFETCWDNVRSIDLCRRRGSAPAKFKRVPVREFDPEAQVE